MAYEATALTPELHRLIRERRDASEVGTGGKPSIQAL